MANTVHGYMSQSDKGEIVIGGGTDGHNNYTQRGSFQHIEETVRALIETFPMISRLKMLRQWGGIVDVTGDRSPILSKTPLGNCFINCGWGTGGFKAIPGSGWAMAELVAKGHSPLTAEFGLDRSKEGRFIDESVAAGVAQLKTTKASVKPASWWPRSSSAFSSSCSPCWAREPRRPLKAQPLRPSSKRQRRQRNPQRTANSTPTSSSLATGGRFAAPAFCTFEKALTC